MKTRRFFAVICAIAMMVSFAGSFGNVTRAEEKAKYIFLFIGDGMGNSHVAATESYLSYKAGKLGGEQLCFTQFPYLGLATTYSANANVTCSSAAGTAIACGAKTNNGMVGVDQDNYKRSFSLAVMFEFYAMARIIADPSLSFDEIERDYLRQFGAAAPEMKEYYGRVRERGEKARFIGNVAHERNYTVRIFSHLYIESKNAVSACQKGLYRRSAHSSRGSGYKDALHNSSKKNLNRNIIIPPFLSRVKCRAICVAKFRVIKEPGEACSSHGVGSQ